MLRNITNFLNASNRMTVLRTGSKALSTETAADPVPKEKTMSTEEDVIIEEKNNTGIITLNRPKTLNALNLAMVRKIFPVLKQWENTKDLVIMRGAGGKAFCAGGDVKTLALSLKEEGGDKVGKEFFREEYTLNHLIGTYKKPYVALINGITMGGGVGLSVHGKYRVATEKTLFAMPETAIGLFPDVGGSHFLPQLKGKLGLFLGLTGHRLTGADVLHAGIATHYITSDKLESLVESLTDSSPEDVGAILTENQSEVETAFSLGDYMTDINDLFSEPSMMDIVMRLRSADNEWAKGLDKQLSKMSPTSLKLTFQAFQKGKNKTLAECLKMEYRLAYSCMRRESDFYEGVRALLIDKDQSPMWNPRTIGDVTDKYVSTHFSPLPEGEELELLEKSNL